VTASALFDLTSQRWMETLTERLVAEGVPLLALLSYDGRAVLDPPHAEDGAVISAINRHQMRDKGLGPAAGPGAAAFLARALAGHGWRVDQEQSDWRLGPRDGALMMQTIEGWRAAAAEEGIPRALLDTWISDRRRTLTALRIGHRDLFARPAS
jgi:hypothetical protein